MKKIPPPPLPSQKKKDNNYSQKKDSTHQGFHRDHNIHLNMEFEMGNTDISTDSLSNEMPSVILSNQSTHLNHHNHNHHHHHHQQQQQHQQQKQQRQHEDSLNPSDKDQLINLLMDEIERLKIKVNTIVNSAETSLKEALTVQEIFQEKLIKADHKYTLVQDENTVLKRYVEDLKKELNTERNQVMKSLKFVERAKASNPKKTLKQILNEF